MESKKVLENEVYVTPECDVIELGVEGAILINSPLNGASHDRFQEDDYSNSVVWE